jgi:hypothetical protein
MVNSKRNSPAEGFVGGILLEHVDLISVSVVKDYDKCLTQSSGNITTLRNYAEANGSLPALTNMDGL